MKRALCGELRQRLIDRAKQVDPDNKAAIALSGGVDSVTALFAMLAAGKRPRCYTFYMQGYESPDLVAAKRIAKDFGLDHVLIPIPVDHDQIVADVRVLVQHARKIKKTIIQCMHPWLYVGPQMQARGDKHILIGFSAGNIFCLSRRDTKARAALGEAGFLAAGWREHRFTDLRFVDGNVALFCKERFGITMDDFFAVDPIFDWHKPFTIDEIHRADDGSRLEKASFIYAFEDFYKKGDYYRKGSSYQVNSKLRDFHDGLLWNPKYNPRNSKAIIAIYNDIAKGAI